jgi:cyclopropane fatty-acyl-phospholipid synthase-like methyltransferase
MYDDGRYLERNPEWHSGASAWKAAQIVKILDGAGIRFDSVVEVGCGAGAIIAELARYWPKRRLMGYDISADAAQFWARHAQSGVTYRNADFLATEEKADLVLAIDVFEHVEDYMGFLRRLSKRGEAFVFHIPLDLHVSALMRDRQISTREQVGHLHYFSRATALATLKDCGYAIERERFTPLSLETEEGGRGLSTTLANAARRTLSRLASTELSAKLLGGYSLLVLARPRGDLVPGKS